MEALTDRDVSRFLSGWVVPSWQHAGSSLNMTFAHRTIYVFRRVIVVYCFVSTNCGSSSEDLETCIDSVHDHSMLTHLRRQQPGDGDAVDFTAVTVVASAVWTQRLIVSELGRRPIRIYSRYRTSYSRRMKSCRHW